MSNKITGKEYPLLKIFSPDFEYHIPAYQRPYAWTEEETGILFDDLFEFYQTEPADNYFLGSIVLIKDDSDPHADVIDGQQRLTTLSILFAALADQFSGKRKTSCIKYLQDEGDEIAGIEARPRVFLREWDQPFFNKYIQNVRLNDLQAIDPATLDTESKRHIQSNCKILRDRFADSFQSEDELVDFSKFLLNRCYIVVVYTPNQESAFRVFSVMNSRGLDLLPTDIIKSETIGKLPVVEQATFTNKWEELENLTGREGFNEVFTHTRTIFAKERPKKNLLEEFREYVLKKTQPKELIERYLIPYANAYEQLKKSSFTATHHADEINKELEWLNKTNNYDWMPPAIKFLAEHPNDSEYICWFITKLERLASFLLVTAQDVNHRMDRYKWLLVEMENRPDNSLLNPLKNVELTNWEKQEFIRALDGEIYTMPALRRNYIIQRLDSFVSDGGASYNTKIFTIEHVLPQNPSQGSEWLQQWDDPEKRRYWLNRIANLVPLTRQRNSAAQNYDFATKKVKYFQTKSGTSSFSLTTQVVSMDFWTPDIVEQRQKYLCDKFTEKWDLRPSGTADNQDYILAGRGGNASGFPVDAERFTVRKGSRIASTVTEGFQQGYANLRDQLISDRVIADDVFTVDYTFSSVSAAAAVILGRAANGRKEWTKLDGRSIGQVGQ